MRIQALIIEIIDKQPQAILKFWQQFSDKNNSSLCAREALKSYNRLSLDELKEIVHL
jgi:hypothetical protein